MRALPQACNIAEYLANTTLLTTSHSVDSLPRFDELFLATQCTILGSFTVYTCHSLH